MRIAAFLALLMSGLMTANTLQAQEARVELELMMARGFPPQDSHEWARALRDVGADGVRIRNASVGDDVGIKNVGTDRRPSYKVYGFLTRDNELVFEGATFRKSQLGGIRAYIDRLRSEGIDGLLTEKMAFGLSADELVSLHEDLSQPVRIETKSKQVGEVVKQLENRLKTDLRVDAAAARTFDSRYPVLEEFSGVSAGTTLAALVRPLGCVVVPTKNGREVTLVIKRTQDADEHWPIGWPLEGSPLKAAPKLFESVPVEISNFGLKDGLDFVEGRVGLPFIYDQNFMAEKGIELDEIKVTVQGKMSYSRVVRRMLSQSRPSLFPELRQDEQGKPFFWISSVTR